ncbi:hypothetical protein SAMN05660916_02061 [Arthrobacter sp. 31Cvi3.1E]|nr:hypothetical protein [Paenarthrobacter nicotinovorans]SKB67365.1 hypothetical protein SAMN05660916_02061 [Arthrobacter sp. 31Cvi3.1E]
MATLEHRQKSHRHANRFQRIDSVSLSVLFIAVVAIAVILVGVAKGGTSPAFLILPTLVGCWAIWGLRR